MAEQILREILLGVAAAGIAYLAVLIAVLVVERRRPKVTSAGLPPITVLKPVCGTEPHLYENLRSYCMQDYPSFQVVFGARDAADPALTVVRRLIEEMPERDLSITVDGRVIGRNYKVSNLANMIRAARHDLIVMADSDTRVGPDYLGAIAMAFTEPSVGAATCLYRGVVGDGRASALGALYLNDWYMPSFMLASRFSRLDTCFGQTMAASRRALADIGGIEALKDHIADDYMLGRLISRAGYRVALAPCVIDNVVCETDLRALFTHELRWARTLRTVRPLSYPFTVLTDALPLSLFAFVATGLSAEGGVMFLAAVVMRLALHGMARLRFGARVPFRPWLVPYRDMVTFAVRISCFVGHGISWRGHRFTLKPSGHMIAVD